MLDKPPRKRPKPDPRDNRVLTGIRLPPDLLEGVDNYCRAHEMKPSRTRIIEIAMRQFLEREKAAAAHRSPQ